MCGICGVVALGRAPEVETAREDPGELRHRGPDGEGEYASDGVALGHARLAIIDLTDGGHQPFASEDGALQLLHNGEIYNYIELRHRARVVWPPLPLDAPTPRWSSPPTRSGASAASSASTACGRSRSGTRAGARSSARATASASSRSTTGGTAAGSSSRASLEHCAPTRSMRAEPNLRAVRDFIEQGYTDHRDETFFAGVQPASAGHNLIARRARPRASSASGSSYRRDPPADPVGAVPRAVRRRGPAAAAQRRARSGRRSPAGSTRPRSQ